MKLNLPLVSQAKIAVRSTDREIDPVGACVGMKGSRVQNIVNELQGEKIDIVKWSDELTEFARAALAPAEIANIMIDSANGSLDVVVEDDQLSLAIGRKGQNVRLAAMLSGYKINIISKTKLQSKIKRSTENLLQITTINDPRAQVLVQSGIMSVADLNDMTSEELREILNVEINIAEAILAETKAAVENDTVKLVPTEEEEIVSASAVPAYKGILDGDSKESTPAEQKSKFSDAEKRLREELAAFKLK